MKVSAGSYDLNRWLYGGYESGIITTLYGGPGVGKTNLCLLAAVSQARKGNHVIFIDTEGGFSIERVKQLLGSSEEDFQKTLEHILVLKPTNFKEQDAMFSKLGTYLNGHASLIIVDGMTMLYRLDFASAREKDLGEIQRVNADLTRQMRILVEIARKQDIPVLATNQVYSWDNESRMVGGDIIRYWSKCLIELVRVDGRRIAHLRKHRSLAESSMTFQIVQEGIKKRGWI